jgi:hypothetical protein
MRQGGGGKEWEEEEEEEEEVVVEVVVVAVVDCSDTSISRSIQRGFTRGPTPYKSLIYCRISVLR